MIGSIVLAPLNGLAFICREIANAVEKSLEAEKGQLMGELRALHQRIERKEIEERAFVEKETALLDRLDEINAQLRR
jgi:flagellar biosynthesis/type III secretory pathway chaperone